MKYILIMRMVIKRKMVDDYGRGKRLLIVKKLSFVVNIIPLYRYFIFYFCCKLFAYIELQIHLHKLKREMKKTISLYYNEKKNKQMRANGNEKFI